MIIINENKLIKGGNRKELLTRLKQESNNDYSINRIRHAGKNDLCFMFVFNIKNKSYEHHLYSCDEKIDVDFRMRHFEFHVCFYY